MLRATQIRRLVVFTALMVCGLGALGYRLVELQYLRHEELLSQARANTVRVDNIEARRGDIRDARGNLLATSLPAKTVCADPSLIGRHAPELARALAPVLQLPEEKLREELTPRLRRNELGALVTNRYVVLQRKVSLEVWQQVRQVMATVELAGVNERTLTNKAEKRFYAQLRQKAIFADTVDDSLRIYPNKQLAAHVLGYTGLHETQARERRIMATTGMDGVELAFNSRLSGVRGWRVTEKDLRNCELVAFREQDIEPEDGLNVVLTLDSGVQFIVESELADAFREQRPDSASCVVVRPQTGEILAMATLPNFDPNRPGDFDPAWRRNRIITDVNEPGSTFKVVVVAGALNEKVVRLEDVFFCENGNFAYGGHVLHDHKRYGNLTVEGIITKSSNIGAAKIGIQLGEQRLYEYIRRFGFGQATGAGLPGEVAGIVPPPARWSKVTIAQMPMGHGLAVTPLQMTMAMAAIANQGVMMKPMIVSRLEDRQGRAVARYEPLIARRVVSPEAASLMVRALKTVVTSEGTAPNARLAHYSCAGKTGTAQKPEGNGYSHEKYFSSFIGFFPADAPEVCIGVFLDYPKAGHYGGEVCGPVFKRIAERVGNYLNIQPDLREEPSDKTVTGRNRWLMTARKTGHVPLN